MVKSFSLLHPSHIFLWGRILQLPLYPSPDQHIYFAFMISFWVGSFSSPCVPVITKLSTLALQSCSSNEWVHVKTEYFCTFFKIMFFLLQVIYFYSKYIESPFSNYGLLKADLTKLKLRCGGISDHLSSLKKYICQQAFNISGPN